MGNIIIRQFTKKENFKRTYLAFTILLCIMVVALTANTFDTLDKFKHGFVDMDEQLLQKTKGNGALSIFGVFCIIVMAVMNFLIMKMG